MVRSSSCGNGSMGTTSNGLSKRLNRLTFIVNTSAAMRHLVAALPKLWHQCPAMQRSRQDIEIFSPVRNAFSKHNIFDVVCLPIVWSFFVSPAFAAETNASTNDLSARIKTARAEKKIDDRLNALANVAKTLSLPEIPQAIHAADDLKQLRE